MRYIPEELETGICFQLPLEENSILESYCKFSKSGFLQRGEIREYAKMMIERYKIDPPNPTKPMGEFSGGTIRKVLVGRVIEENPKVLIAHNPTLGLDYRTQRFLRNKLLELSRNSGIILFSDDLDEIFEICDRVGVIYEGKLYGPYRVGKDIRKVVEKQMLGLELS